MTDAPVNHFEVVGNDGKALPDSYSNLLGWQFNTNDHQFAAEHPGVLAWVGLERGPVARRVRIGRVAAPAAVTPS